MTLTGLLAAATFALLIDVPVTVDTNEVPQMRDSSGTGKILVRPELNTGEVEPVGGDLNPLPLTGSLVAPQTVDTLQIGFHFTRPQDKRGAERVSFYYREVAGTLDPATNDIEHHQLIRTVDVPAGQEEIVFQHTVTRGSHFSAWAAGAGWKQSCKRISPVF